jgi:trigger factor
VKVIYRQRTGCRSAGVAELVDAPDLGSGDASRGGSIPFARTSLRPTDHTRSFGSYEVFRFEGNVMQVHNTHSDGLKRVFTVVLPASELDERLTGELATIKDRVRINGFRPGKVPVAHLRRVYGRSVMADVLQNIVNETNRKIVDDNGFKLAMEPKIDFPEEKDQIEAVMEARGDLEYKVSIEILPHIELKGFDNITLTRLVVEPTETEINEMVTNLANQNRSYAAKEGKTVKVADGDRAIIDFVGKIDDVAFEGGSGTDVPLVIGSGSFIPGFEEQLVGAKIGEERDVNVSFPEEYGASHLAGKAAVFHVTIKGIEAPAETAIDDELAKAFGLESLEQLRERVKENLSGELNAMSRARLKKELLDQLDKDYDFDLPPTLLEQEFEGVWQQVMSEQAQTGKSFEDEGTTEEDQREEFRKIAARRVRMGLVLAEIGEKAGITIANEEVSRAVMARAQQFPGQERMVWEFYQKNPQALNEIRAPLFEEKVVDHILTVAKVSDKLVSRDELIAADAEDADDKPKAAKKTTKKAAAKKDTDEAAGSEDDGEAKPKSRAKAKKD